MLLQRTRFFPRCLYFRKGHLPAMKKQQAVGHAIQVRADKLQRKAAGAADADRKEGGDRE